MYVRATEVASRGGTKPSKAIPIAGRFSEGHSWKGREKPSKLIRTSKNWYYMEREINSHNNGLSLQHCNSSINRLNFMQNNPCSSYSMTIIMIIVAIIIMPCKHY